MTDTRRRLLLAALAVVSIAAAAVLAVNGFRYVSGPGEQAGGDDAVGAASRTVAAMFSYDYTTAQTELPKAADDLTGEFRADYLKLVHEAIVPGAEQKKLTVKATVVAGGVVSAERDRAVVLLFLDQVTTGADSPQGTSTGSRVRVTVDKPADRWLVSQVTPI